MEYYVAVPVKDISPSQISDMCGKTINISVASVFGVECTQIGFGMMRHHVDYKNKTYQHIYSSRAIATYVF